MDVAYASKTSYTGGFSGSGGTTMALPSGSTAGELHILIYGYGGHSDSNNTVSFSNSAGEMTELHVNGEREFADSGYTGSFFGGAKYFFATSTDISNGNISMHGSDTFSYTGYADLYRISGDTSESLLSASYDIVTGATPSFDNDVTGTSASSILLLMSISASTSATLTASGYAVTTDNPTFTEITDTTQGSGGGQRVGIHTAYSNTRTSTNSTGNSTISLANGSSGTTSYCVLVSIGNPENVTITIDSAGILNTSMPEPSFILDNNISIDTPGTLTLSSADMIITTSENTVWNYEEKPNTTWTNEQQ